MLYFRFFKRMVGDRYDGIRQHRILRRHNGQKHLFLLFIVYDAIPDRQIFTSICHFKLFQIETRFKTFTRQSFHRCRQFDLFRSDARSKCMGIDTLYPLGNDDDRIGVHLRHFDELPVSVQNKPVLVKIHFCFFRKNNVPQLGAIIKKTGRGFQFFLAKLRDAKDIVSVYNDALQVWHLIKRFTVEQDPVWHKDLPKCTPRKRR